MAIKYKRVLLKLSGEALMGERQHGIDPKRLAIYAEEIKKMLQSDMIKSLINSDTQIIDRIKESSSFSFRRSISIGDVESSVLTDRCYFVVFADRLSIIQDFENIFLWTLFIVVADLESFFSPVS